MCPVVGLLGHTVVPFLVCKAPPYCSPWWRYPYTFLPSVQEGSLFSTTSPAFIVSRLFDEGHSDRCEVISCTFDSHYSNNEWRWTSFHVPLGLKSKREKQIPYINAYMSNLEKRYRWTQLQVRDRDTDAKKGRVDVAAGKRGWDELGNQG